MSQPAPSGYVPVQPHGYRGPTWGQPDPARAFLAGRSRRMVAALLVALSGACPLALMELQVAVAQSTVGVHWATWTTVGAIGVLLLAAALLTQMNNPSVLREPAATRLARWSVRVAGLVGAGGVVASVVVLWAGRSQGWQEIWRDQSQGHQAWWSVMAAPGLVVVGTCLVLWLGEATLRGLRTAPEGFLDSRAAERDHVWLRKAFDPGWRTRMRVVMVAVTFLGLGAGVLAMPVASDRSGTWLAVVAVFVVTMMVACAGYAALDVAAPQAVRRATLAGVLLVVGMLGFVVSLFVMEVAADGPPLVYVAPPLLGIALVVSTVESAARAVGRARRGVLGAQTASWVAAQDATRAGTLHR